MSKRQWPSGLVTAMVTPMKDEGIDRVATQRLIERQVEAGVGGVLVAGGTGEHGALTVAERTELVAVVAESSNGRLPFIVQTGALTTRDAVKLSQDAQAIGAAGLLVAAPFGEPLNWREKRAFFEAVNAAVSLPIMLYNTSTAGLMGMQHIEELAALSNVSAIKQSSSDATLLGDMLVWSKTQDFAVYTGWDDLVVPAALAGAHGALLGAGNVVPELIVQVWNLCARRELSPGLDALWSRLRPFLRLIGESENYVSIVKAGAQLRGLEVGDVRAPYLMPRNEERQALADMLTGLSDVLLPPVTDGLVTHSQ
jgi:4-hydroxy-tetrahydrodipicolinate synthase